MKLKMIHQEAKIKITMPESTAKHLTSFLARFSHHSFTDKMLNVCTAEEAQKAFNALLATELETKSLFQILNNHFSKEKA